MKDQKQSHDSPWRRWIATVVAALGFVGMGLGAATDQALLDAVAAGDASAQYRLGLGYLRGIDDDRKLKEGVDWIVAAARSGFPPARTHLAELYMRGTVVPYEPQTAFRLLLESALEGHLAAAYGVAHCFRIGLGVDPDPAKAEEWFARAANVEVHDEATLDGESLRTVGLCYRDGDGVPKSYSIAARWLLKAAQAGSPRALFELGNFYAFGLGVAPDDHKAFALYTKAAYAGSTQASLAVSRCYRDGKGPKADIEEATTWSERTVTQYEEEARLGSLDAATDLYLYLSRGVLGRDPDRAMAWLEKAVARQYPRALTLLGEALATGNGIEQDIPRAVRHLEAAATLHEGGAHYLLFQLYLRGEGIPLDASRALQHLRDAARTGNVSAMSKLAEWYLAHPDVPEAAAQAKAWQARALEANLALAERNQLPAQLALITVYGRGYGTPKDQTKAMYWMQRAAQNGHDEAQYLLANAFDRGLGVQRDPEQAVRWYRAAAAQDYTPAMLNLAVIYEKGELGVEKDSAAAQQWYDTAFSLAEEAAHAGDRDAAYMMATFYRKGLGREPNSDQVLHWLHRAAELGDTTACIELSRIYSEGRNVIRNADEAYRLLRMAADAGNPEGRFLLGRLYDEGDYVERDYQRAYELYYLAAEQGYPPARSLLDEMEVTLSPAIIRRVRTSADAVRLRERLAAGDLAAIEPPAVRP